MPKERIAYGQPSGQIIGDKFRVSAEGGTSLDVHWTRDLANVQIGIEFPAEAWIAIADYLDSNPETKSHAIYTDDLSRQQINHLIKTLRRARDASFGPDE